MVVRRLVVVVVVLYHVVLHLILSPQQPFISISVLMGLAERPAIQTALTVAILG
jgi:hypothetical protein